MKEILTTFEISRLCKVDITTVINWVKTGKLRAYKTPGGHRRVRCADFMKFLKKYDLPIPKELENGRLLTLIVDDEEEIRKFIKKLLLEKWPSMEIYDAEDGFAAGKLLAEKCPSLVILDIRLPGIDGIQVCKLIREDGRLKDTKIIAITGYSSVSVKKHILQAGANDYLEKPFSQKNFFQCVEKLV